MPALAADRWIASYFSEAYEQATTPYIGIITLIFAIVITLILETLHYLEFIYVTTIILVVAGFCLIALLVSKFLNMEENAEILGYGIPI